MIKKQKGFTLVEMIIVTVIIGILAGIVITVINIPRVQAKSRDSKRIGDLKMIQNALELYFSDYRQYPSDTAWLLIDSVNDIADLDKFISSVPLDPRNGQSSGTVCFTTAGDSNYGYYYRSMTSGTYILGGIMEVMNTADEKKSCSEADTSNCATGLGYGCNSDTRCYCVQNPM